VTSPHLPACHWQAPLFPSPIGEGKRGRGGEVMFG
jgi:hypothetical protein